MLSRSTVGRSAQLAARRQCCAQPVSRRGLTSFSYDTAEVGGVKVAARDVAGPTTKLAIVAKAGSRYELAPGTAMGLEHFAFKSTANRSAFRITRESELLGSELVSYHNREAVVIGAKFMREDLPYFAELLAEVATKSKFSEFEYSEEVAPQIELAQSKFLADASAVALNSAHGVAFHTGLGNSIVPLTKTPLHKYISGASVKSYASAALAKSNIAVVANGASQAELSKWVGEFFSEVPAASASIESTATQYFGGEERIASDASNSIVLAFPGSSSYTAGSSYKPEVAVLAALLGGKSSIKWSPGFSLLAKSTASSGASVSTSNFAYSDAGLLAVTISGSAAAVRAAAFDAVAALKSLADGAIGQEEFAKAVAQAKFNALAEGESLDTGLLATGSGLVQGGKAFQFDEISSSISSVTPEKVSEAVKAMFAGKATVSAVGDLYTLPFAEELGLTV